MSDLDNRLHAFRPDLADEHLRGRVIAENFVKGYLAQVTQPIISLRRQPQSSAMQLSQALYGEKTIIFEEKNGWCWVQLLRDGYVGYVEARSLSAEIETTNYEVVVPLTMTYPEPNIKTSPIELLPMQAQICVVAQEGLFWRLANGRYIYQKHVKALSTSNEASHSISPQLQAASDYVAIALRFLNTAYFWGGKTALGIDCSGLVQIALQATGRHVRRDSDMQADTLGHDLALNDLTALRRGDLIFWKGHVGIMTDHETLLHANGYHMLTVTEPLSEVIARSEEAQSPITRIKRL